ncbi:hypothetical protein JCM3765_000770 [Sporobolomyces pararoseus]
MVLLSELPAEVLDSIFTFVYEKGSTPLYLDQANLRNLALVSKQFLPVARSFLYFRPLTFGIFPTIEKARLLLSALEANDRELGKLVYDLQHLVEWSGSLSTSDANSGPPRFAHPPRSFTWYLSMLSACPNLVNSDLTFPTANSLSQVIDALSSSPQSTIKSASIIGSVQDLSMYRVPHQLVLKALREPALSQLVDLKLRDIEDDESDGPAAVNIRLRSLEARGLWLDSRQAKQYLPIDPSRLRILILECDPLSPLDVDYIFSHLPASIESISITSPQKASPSFANSPPIPHEPFSRFYKLSSLTLGGFFGPSNDLLDVLGSSCLFLSKVDFEDSFWRMDEGVVPVQPTAFDLAGVLDFDRVTASLELMSQLSRINFGILPPAVAEDSHFKQLVAKLKKRKIKVRYTSCHFV